MNRSTMQTVFRHHPWRLILAVLLLGATLACGLVVADEPGLGLETQNIATGRFSYVTRLQIGDIDTQIESVREIRADSVDGRPSLRVETTSITGMGKTVDLLQLDADNLYPLNRLITQGDGRLELNYTREHVSGLIRAAGQLISIDLALAEPAYAGDAGLDTLLGGLPLRAGLRGELQAVETDVDVYVQRFSFVVDAAELVETPAGTFESWPVRIEAVDDPDYRQTVWLSTDLPRLFIQAQAPIPAETGGGVLLTQLVTIERDDSVGIE